MSAGSPSSSKPVKTEAKKRKQEEKTLREQASDRWLRVDEDVSDTHLAWLMEKSEGEVRVVDKDLDYERGRYYWQIIQRYDDGHLGDEICVLTHKASHRIITDARGMLICCNDNPFKNEQAGVWYAPATKLNLPLATFPKKRFISKYGMRMESEQLGALDQVAVEREQYFRLLEAQESGDWQLPKRVKTEPSAAAASSAASSVKKETTVKTEARGDEDEMNYEEAGSPGDWTADPVPFAGKKCAFLVGNNAYIDKKNVLHNAVPDAESLGMILGVRGFDIVKVHRNIQTPDLFSAAFDEFMKLVGVGDLVVFYYAGHAYVSGKTHDFVLEMCNLKVNNKKVLTKDGDAQVKFADITKKLFAGPKLWGAATIIDACRSTDATRASGHQLGDVRLPLMPNQIHVYSCAAEETASDGSTERGHGLFTGELLEVMQLRPPTGPLQTDFERIIRETTFRVQEHSKKADGSARQSPWVSSSINTPLFII